MVSAEQDTATTDGLHALADILRTGHFVLFITGAGLSVASGISTYRVDGASIWNNFIYEWGTREKFLEDPLEWYNKFWLRTHEKIEYFEAQPNEGHRAITRVYHRCKVKVVTQNIDRLHLKSGMHEKDLVEVHGRLGLYKCVNLNMQKEEKKGRKKKRVACPYAIGDNIHSIDITKYKPKKNTSFKDGSLEITELPLCPHCSDPALPQALLFDEEYKSHDFYRWKDVLNWIQRSVAIVFVGTSFSVGITQEAIAVCREQGKSMFNFNVRIEDEVAHEKGMYHIMGKSEITLPALDRLLQRGKNGKPRLFYHPQGYNDPFTSEPDDNE